MKNRHEFDYFSVQKLHVEAFIVMLRKEKTVRNGSFSASFPNTGKKNLYFRPKWERLGNTYAEPIKLRQPGNWLMR